MRTGWRVHAWVLDTKGWYLGRWHYWPIIGVYNIEFIFYAAFLIVSKTSKFSYAIKWLIAGVCKLWSSVHSVFLRKKKLSWPTGVEVGTFALLSPMLTIELNTGYVKRRKIKIKELQYNPEISHLGIYPKEPKSVFWRDICIPMFTVIRFTRQDSETT